MAVSYLKLPFAFDTARLQNDLATIDPGEWTLHFNRSYYDGEWSGVALRTTEGAHVAMYPDPSKNTSSICRFCGGARTSARFWRGFSVRCR